MTRAVIVNAVPDQAQRHAEILRAAGHEVELCGGPDQDPCPVLGGLPCPLADRADVLVYDARVVGDDDAVRRLVAEVRETYADLPLILTSVDPRLAWVSKEGPARVHPIAGDPAPDELLAAVEAALDEQGMAI